MTDAFLIYYEKPNITCLGALGLGRGLGSCLGRLRLYYDHNQELDDLLARDHTRCGNNPCLNHRGGASFCGATEYEHDDNPNQDPQRRRQLGRGLRVRSLLSAGFRAANSMGQR